MRRIERRSHEAGHRLAGFAAEGRVDEGQDIWSELTGAIRELVAAVEGRESRHCVARSAREVFDANGPGVDSGGFGSANAKLDAHHPKRVEKGADARRHRALPAEGGVCKRQKLGPHGQRALGKVLVA